MSKFLSHASHLNFRSYVKQADKEGFKAVLGGPSSDETLLFR